MKQLDFINARLKYLAFIVLLCCSYTVSAQFPAPYCANAFPNGVEPITLVNFAGIDNATTAVLGAAASPAHEDFTAMVGNVNAGSAYQILLNGNTDGGWTNTLIVYIDWNQDGDFTDSDETYPMGTIFSFNGTTSTPIEKTILVPADAMAGTTRMRVMKKFNTTPLPPCYNGVGDAVAYGQSEDYSLEVTVPNCTPPAVAITDLTSVSVSIEWPAIDGVTGYEYVLDEEAAAPDAAGTATTEVSFTDSGLTALTTYYFHIRTNCGSEFSDWYTLQFKTLLANDTCATATDLGGETSPLSSTTVGSANDSLIGCLNVGGTTANAYGDVYYSIAVPNGSTLSIGQTANDYDSTNTVFYGDCDNRTQIDCFDDDDFKVVTWANDTGEEQTVYWVQDGHGGVGAFTLAWSVIACTPATATFTVNSLCEGGTDEFEIVTDVTGLGSATSLTVADDQGNTQAVTVVGPVVFGPYANGTAVEITVTNDQDGDCVVTSPALNQTDCPPANDDCIGAEALTVNEDLLCGTATPGTIAGATGSVVTGNTCNGTADDDVWYSFVATSTLHRIRLMNVSGSTDMYHSVWTGDCGNLILVAGSCSDDNTSNPNNLIAGQTYYVRVYSYGSAKLTTTFDICIGTPPPPPPPPANDNCSGAEELTVNADYSCAEVTAGTVLGATPSSVTGNTCSGTADDDVWYSFVATSTLHRIRLTNVSGFTDMYHSLWTGDCNNLTLVSGSCSDSDTSNPTGLTIGQTYYVRVYTYTSSSGQTATFNVCIGTPQPPPVNDDLIDALPITCGNTYTGSTEQATIDENSAPDGGGADLDAPNIWYTYTGTGSPETITLDLCGSDYDTSVLVYTGTSGNLAYYAANDDGSEAACGTDLGTRSYLNFNSDGVTTYYITVEGYNPTNIGNLSMEVTCTTVTPPAVENQTCDLALSVPVDGTVTESDNSFGTVNPVQPTCDIFGAIQDVWFSFEAPALGSVEVAVDPGSMISTNLAIYSGSCASLTLVPNTCDYDQPTGAIELLTGLVEGNTYYIQVWSSFSEQGTFSVSVLDQNLGIKNPDVNNFSFYPNPVKDILTLTNSQSISNVAVYNLLGQQVITKPVNANEAKIDMSGLAVGTYIVKFNAGDIVKTVKVLKQ